MICNQPKPNQGKTVKQARQPVFRLIAAAHGVGLEETLVELCRKTRAGKDLGSEKWSQWLYWSPQSAASHAAHCGWKTGLAWERPAEERSAVGVPCHNDTPGGTRTADLHKIAYKVTTVTKKLINQVQELTKQQVAVVAKLEDQEGRACRNSIRIKGIPERAVGQSAELFIEDLILNNKRLSH
ncbi:hypothetical protein NDU88_000513 [Pleurodeles waltl]|uniref:Uncharacterized protein n=1 Tax=Pleurodeles waltl TaxID=8319 RepID=A0AAV7P194_PLEWA|nr:hypothetical protein NDU88_000513 [Pleurodeles waltl]